MEVSSCSVIATTRSRDAYLCISTSCLAISVLYVSQVFKRVILQQNKHYYFSNSVFVPLFPTYGKLALGSVKGYLLILLFNALQMSLQADVKMFPEAEIIARVCFFLLEVVVLSGLFGNVFFALKEQFIF